MNATRIVIDTNILVSGLRSRRGMSYLLKRAENGSRMEFMDIMERVPDVPADPRDTK